MYEIELFEAFKTDKNLKNTIFIIYWSFDFFKIKSLKNNDVSKYPLHFLAI